MENRLPTVSSKYDPYPDFAHGWNQPANDNEQKPEIFTQGKRMHKAKALFSEFFDLVAEMSAGDQDFIARYCELIAKEKQGNE